MFTSARFNQAIDGVIGVIGARLNSAILEIDRLLSVILDMRNIARRVIRIVKVLHARGWRRWVAPITWERCASRGIETGHAERKRVIFVLCTCTIAIRNQDALAPGVVINICNKAGCTGRTAYIPHQALQQTSFVIGHMNYCIVWRDPDYLSIESVIRCGTAIG